VRVGQGRTGQDRKVLSMSPYALAIHYRAADDR
jgi:hypothetical protein